MAIVLSNISKSFGELSIIHKLSFTIQEGELMVLLGGSGSGKSTLLRLIAGLITPDTGTIELNGKEVTILPPQERGVGMVFQHYALFKHMSARENIEFGLKIRGVSRPERKQRSDELLELVGLTGLGERRPSELSGGQRQRVALARALSYNPSVLLLDEPFGALDVKIRLQLRNNFKELQRHLRIATLLVTHDQEEAFELGDRIGILEGGKLIEVGTPTQLYHSPHSEAVATFLGSGNVLVGHSEHGKIRLGSTLISFPEGSPVHEEGSPVRILFRPESLVLSKSMPQAKDNILTLGQGRLKERVFGGGLEKYRFEILNLQGVRPLSPPLRYGEKFVTIEVSRPCFRNQEPDQLVGEDTIWLSVKKEHLHVLEPSGIRLLVPLLGSSSDRQALELAKNLTRCTHGPLTLLGVHPPTKPSEQFLHATQSLTREIMKEEEAQPQIKIRQGKIVQEVLSEIREGFYDIVLLLRTKKDTSRNIPRLLLYKLLNSGTVALLIGSEEPSEFRQLLVCTAGGEPGKNDIRFSIRLARHLPSKITVLHAVNKGISKPQEERAKRHLNQAKDMAEAFKVDCEIKLCRGSPSDVIPEEINSGNYDLIVLGAPGTPKDEEEYGLLERMLRESKKPVLIVPMGRTG